MNKKAFIVCPFSNMEDFIRKKYGSDAIFIKTIGGVVSSKGDDFVTSIQELVSNQGVKSLYVVNDTDCRFIGNVIHREPLYGTTTENLLERTYSDHYSTISEEPTLYNQKFKLAELNVRQQLSGILQKPILKNQVIDQGVEIKGLVATQSSNQFEEITL